MAGKNGSKRQRGQHWRLGGANAPLWLNAPCCDRVKRTTRDDLKLLNEALRPRKLSSIHPLRRLWDLTDDCDALAEARFECHHLADDIRVVSGVPGAQSLLSAMRSDADGYEDFRYELRMAASMARVEGQRVVRLAGKRAGPDIEVVTPDNGTLYGIACYRGKTTTPAVLGFEDRVEDTMHRLAMAQQSLHPPAGKAVMTELVLPEFPPEQAHLDLGVDLFGQLWSSKGVLGSPTLERNGIKVARTKLYQPSIHESWEARIRLLLPVPAREKFRLTRSMREKLEREKTSWAQDFDGVAVFAIEESNFCLGLPQEILEALLQKEAVGAFESILTTVAYFGAASTKGRFRLEELHWVQRSNDGNGPGLKLETFSDNLEEFGKGHLVASSHPTYATYEWVVVGLNEAVMAVGLTPLSINRRLSRVPVTPGTPLTGEGLRPQIEELVTRLRPNDDVKPLPPEMVKMLRSVLEAGQAKQVSPR